MEGEILDLFEDIHSPLTAAEIAFYLHQPRDLVLLSSGCLIRQGLVKAALLEEDLWLWVEGASKDAAGLQGLRESKG